MVKKSTPSSAWHFKTSTISSMPNSKKSLFDSWARTATSYIGTVPTGTLELLIIVWRIFFRSPPTLRSITASAPYLIAMRNFSNSLFILGLSVEVPRFALILVLNPLPTAQGLVIRRLLLRGMTIVPFFIPALRYSGRTPSRRAIALTILVVIFFLAEASCVFFILTFPLIL